MENEQQSIAALEPLLRFCLDNPSATAQDLRHRVQQLSAGSGVSPIISLLAGNNPDLLQLIAASQNSHTPVAASAPQESRLRCYRCNRIGHTAPVCTEKFDTNGALIVHGQIKFAPDPWKAHYGFNAHGHKAK